MSLLQRLGRRARTRVLQALAAWEVGALRVCLPDGTQREFGQPGAQPRSTLWVDDESLFAKFALRGDLGAGESYMDGDWRSDDLARFIGLVLQNRRHLPLDTRLTKLLNLGSDLFHRRRANTRAGSRRNIREHYDLSNDFFGSFLDETLTYSSAVFEWQGQALADAQRNKYRMIAEKAQLRSGDHVLEIGCGWGGFALFAAREYGCRVTGLTISDRQYELARRRVAAAELERRVEVRCQDYRDATGRYDKVVSIEMFEALGREHWATFFRKLDALLGADGLAVIQTIAIPDHRFEEYTRHCDWLQRYIFPGSLLASVHHVTGAMIRASTLGINHLEDIGIHYAETLRRWRTAFLANLDRVRELGFDERFIRTWEYYLCSCEAAFATRTLGNLQLVLTRPCNLSLPAIPARRPAAA